MSIPETKHQPIPNAVQNSGLGASCTPSVFTDESGYEAAEYAQVWHVYNEEATRVDNAMNDGFHRGIDVLLVFTGLFSAVLTTFIIQTYQQMTPQASDTTNQLLLQLISLQVNGSAGASPSTTSSQLPGAPSLTHLHWVNGLWFAALACSLSAALVSMLAKQWIQQPLTGGTSGNPQFHAARRQKRYQQMLQWHVFTVISSLPILLHIALLLFFAGLIVLLWSGNTIIMATTSAIVAIAYSFYVASFWVSLAYPDCPYQHPLSASLRQWLSEQRQPRRRKFEDLERNVDKAPKPKLYSSLIVRVTITYNFARRKILPTVPPYRNSKDDLEARAIVWLLQSGRSESVVATALQAIGGLPRHFTSFKTLREAGAIQMVTDRFSRCFHRDYDYHKPQWYILDSEAAEKYCRSWIRLTANTNFNWPRNLEMPLQLLRSSNSVQTSVIACCAAALNAVESRESQLRLVTHLENQVLEQVPTNELIQSWILETFLECSLNWEFPIAIRDEIVKKAIPPLLQLLQRASTSPRSPTRCRIALTLQSLTGGNVDTTLLFSRYHHERSYHLTIVPSLAAIIDEPSRFGVRGDLLEYLAFEFSHIVAPIINHSPSLPPILMKEARRTLSTLYWNGRIGVGLIPDAFLADILHVLHPLDDISPSLQPSYARHLLVTLSSSSDPHVAIYSVRLLESLLIGSHPPAIEAVSSKDGVSILVRAANIGDIDSRRLQIDCIRTLCVFIRSFITSFERSRQDRQSSIETLDRHCDSILHSEVDFFSTLISAVNSRRWWLPEIADIWFPSLLQLCRIRPHDPVWFMVESAFRKFAELHDAEGGAQRLWEDLDVMKELISGLDSGRGSMESRRILQPPLSHPPSRKSTVDKAA